MSDSDPDEVEEYDSFAQPTLIDQLKKILDEYPDDGQIIKELIQNADDAEAECMKILYVGNTLNPLEHGEKKYRKFLRGPALVFYNDATFSDADWTGIRTIYNSVKADDPLTVGRFGLGFKSVFHITDYPCIISNDRILFLNPLEKRSDRVCVTIKLNKLQQSKTVDVSDVLAAFNDVFGFSDITLQTGKFPGTMLWFPLRTEATRLSSNTYPEGRVLDLFKAFVADSERSLLFLKGLKSIQLYCCMDPKPNIFNEESGIINFGKDIEFFSVTLREDGQKGASTKKAFIQQVRALDGSIPDQPLYKPLSCVLHIRRRQRDQTERLETQQWFILNLYPGEPITEHLKELIGDKDLCYSPLVAVAACSEESSNFTKQRQGKIFCFQPLPDEMENRTGLPVHVNAFFALTQNRRHIKLPSADQEQFNMQVAKPIEWNKALMTEILPEAYVELILGIIDLSRDKSSGTSVADMVYSIIPDMMKVNPKWTSHAEKVLALLLGKRFLYTKAAGGKWISAKDAIFALPDCLEAIQDLLLMNDIKLVLMPSHILTAIEKLLPSDGLKTVNPEYIFQFMTEDDSYKRLPFQQKIDLLHFLCDSDFKSRLNGLELIPLANGKFASLGSTDTYYIEEDELVLLFPGLEEYFISPKINRHTFTLFEDIARKGDYQVQKLDTTSTPKLIGLLMETDFESLMPPLKVDKGKSKKWKELLKGIWTTILARFPEDIEVFADLPLVPVFSKRAWSKVPSFSLYPLSSLLLSKVDKDGKEMSAELCTVFELLSVNVIHSLPEWINVNAIDKYIYRCTGPSLADLIGRLGIRDVQHFNREASNEQKSMLLTLVSQKFNADILRKSSKEVLAQLELFQEISSPRSDYILVSANTSRGVLNCTGFPVRFPDPLLHLNSAEEEVFVGVLGVKQVKPEDMILNALHDIEAYSEEDRNTLIHWVLTNQYHYRSEQIGELIKSIKFLESGTSVYKLNELFDPLDTLLTSLFAEFEVFPTDKRFTTPKMLAILQELGLKTRTDVTCEDIYKICKRLHSSGSYKKDNKTASDILEFLNERDNFKLLQLSSNQIGHLKWVPIRDENRSEVIRYNKGRGTFVSPKDVKSSKYRDIIGSISPVVDCEKYPQVAEHFSWSTDPPIEKVAEHLYKLVKNNSGNRNAETFQIIIAIYEWLDLLASQDKVREILDGVFSGTDMKYIWTGSGFAQKDSVIVNKQAGDINMKPFRWFVPSELKHLRHFLVSLGCKDTVETMDYVNVLGEIKETCDLHNQHDSRKLLNLTINILNKIKDDVKQGTHSRECTIYVPVQSDILVLQPAQNCTYGNKYESSEEGLLCAHEDLPVSTAEAVGVKSFRQQMMSELEGLEEWGQTEPLTRRLHNLLMEGYVDGFSVPKELFQNADDAKASKLWILYDERDNEDARKDLLDDAMAEMQGPALWVYNDARFTEADFRNITKLSAATKEADPSKIGKFGLGFCSVYNLTDVPCFLSGDSIVMFDPHAKFLGKALPGKSPGLRINLNVEKNRKMLKRLRDQFFPFENIFGCTKMHEMSEYNGTLFRLPLRNRKSDISDVIYRGSEIQDLLSKIKQFSSNLLVFSQNVTEVKLFQIKSGNTPESINLLFSSEKSNHQILHNPVSGSILEAASSLKKANTLEKHPLKTIETISVKAWDCNKEFYGGSNWIVSWATGTDKHSLEMTNIEKGALPLAATAVPFEVMCGQSKIKQIKDLPSCFYQRPHFFCFLPLPLEHPFPFHINGLFSVSSDRRRLRNVTDEDKKGVYQDWNESLMKDAVTEALINLLENAKSLGKMSEFAFFKLWPQEDRSQFTNCLFKSFYKSILVNNNHVFERKGCWYPISECVFLDPSLQKHPHGDIAFEILNQFSTKAVAIDLPVQYYMYLHEANKEVIEEKTVGIITFILKYFLPNLSIVPSKNRNTLLKYAIELKDAEIDTWLKTHNSLPTQPNEDLRLPSEIVDKQSQLGALFFEDEGRFLSDDFAKDAQIKRLWELGVMHETLSDSLLLERANRIGKLDKKCVTCGRSLCKLLIQYFTSNESHHRKAWTDLRVVPFLPVTSRPNDWPSEWEADGLAGDKLKKIKLCNNHKRDKVLIKPVYERATALYCSNLRDFVCCNFLLFDAHACLQNEQIKAVETVLQKRLGLKGRVDVRSEMVLQQIVMFAESFEAMPDNDVQVVNGIMKNLYRFLNDDKLLPTLVFPQENIIWTSGTFTKPIKVAISNFNLDCSPLLFDLQRSPLLPFSKLCDALKIKKGFPPRDILTVLDEIAHKFKEQPVKPDIRKGVINLLESLCLSLDVHRMSHVALLDNSLTVYAPDKDWVLRDSTTMCFQDDSGEETYESMMLVNEALTIKTAKSIGIKSVVTQIMHDTSDSVEFFQDEPLVTRLNNILTGYPCDSGIFKELIQNADDAGAQEIHFLIDFNTYGSDVFDQSYSCLQGPALCVFNDKPFTQNDLKGIQNLGKGSKGEDPSKTGQYGVGFNSVYNLTDAPSFLTKGQEIENGETLCIFDPMAIYLPRSLVNREKPGRRFKDVRIIRAKHKDVIPPYNEEFFSLKTSGTVFRFPLRRTSNTRKSDIKANDVSGEDIQEMLLGFRKEASETLVFLKNLRKLKISVKKEQSSSLEMNIEVDIADKDNEKRASYFKRHAEMCQTFKLDRATIFSLPTLTVDYQLTILEKHKQSHIQTEYLVVQTVGYKDFSAPTIIQEKCKSGELGLLPQGGVASILSVKPVNGAFKGNKTNKAFCFLPLPGETGLPVHVNGHFALDHEGRRGLWKSDNFEQTSCYKTIWNKSLIEGVVTPAYLNLLGIVMKRTSTKVGGKMMMFSKVKDCISEFNSFFPIKQTVLEDYWLLLLKLVYKQIVSQERSFFPSLSWARNEIKGELTSWKARLSWTPLRKSDRQFPAYINEMAPNLDGGNTTDDLKQHQGCTFTNILTDIGMQIVVVPKHIRESLNCANIYIGALSPKVVLRFLASCHQGESKTCLIEVNKSVEKTVVKSVEHMCDIVKYCMKDEAYFIKSLPIIPAFITSDNHVRHVSKDNPVFVTRFHGLFESVQHKFLCSEMAEVLLKKGNAFLKGPELTPFGIDDFKDLISKSSLSCLQKEVVHYWDNEKPSKEWVQMVWQFFRDEIQNWQNAIKDVKKKAALKKLLKSLDTMALIPAFKRSVKSYAEEYYLVPSCKLGVTLDASRFHGTLKTALQRLNLLTLHKELIDSNAANGLFEDICLEVPNSKNPEKLVRCLHTNKDRISEAGLSHPESEAILNYLGHSSDGLRNVVHLMRDLPIFITYHGQLVALSEYKHSLSLQSEHFPKDGLDILTKGKETVFLKTSKDTCIENLYKKLGVVYMSEEDFYMKYIIPNQSMLTRDQFYKHVEYISTTLVLTDMNRRKVAFGKRQKIVEMLKACRFIEIGKMGHCVCVSDLFNSRVKAFKTFCQKEELLPQSFDKDYILKFFEELGLHSHMTVRLFERFAQDIAEKGKQLPISQTLRNKSGRLLKIFTDMQEEIVEQTGFQKLAKVPFIIPQKIPDEMVAISKPFMNEERMVSFSESVFYDKLSISWTTCPVLPNALKIEDDRIKSKLEICSTLFAGLFVKHCRNVGESVCEILKKPISQEISETIGSVMNSIYEHLFQLQKTGKVGKDILTQLSHIPLVYFKDEPFIVKADQTVISCTSKDEIRPFFNKMPIYLGKYSDMFLSLGAAKEPSAKCYISVLKCLQNKCSNDEMLEPDLLIAKHAVANLLSFDVKVSKETFEEDTVLYLPTIRCKMQDARSVIYCDNNYFKRRIGNKTEVDYFLGLDKLEIENITEQQCLIFFQSLPKHIRPVFLTQIVEEITDSTTFREKSDFKVMSIERFVRSPQFSQGLIRLVKHVYKDDSRTWDMTLETTLPQKLRQIRLVPVSGMKTVLEIKTYDNGEYKHPKVVPNSEKVKPVHIEEAKDLTKVYVELGSEWEDDLYKAIVHHLNSFLQNSLKGEFLFVFRSFFKHTDHPSGIADMLDKEKIVSHTFTSSEEPSLFSKPGTIVPKKYHQYLDNSSYVIYEYEFGCVAYQTDDPMLEDRDDSNASATYIFARIVKKLEQTASLPLFDLYEIDIGENDLIQVPAYLLFKFVRKSNTSNQMVLYEGKANASGDNNDAPKSESDGMPKGKDGHQNNAKQKSKSEGERPEELSIHAVCKEIKETLIEAWKKDEVTRKRIVKRLFLKWHPDKNPNRIEFCTKVFQYIQQCIEKLEKGNNLDDYTNSTDNQQGKPGQSKQQETPGQSKQHGKPGQSKQQEKPGQSNSSGGSRYWRRHEDFSDFWREFNERFEREQQFNRDRQRERRRQHDFRHFDSFYFEFEDETEPYPWPEAAKRWQKQAMEDFRFAMDCLANAALPSYNWICYMFHQAAEKSLRAAWYAKDANRIPGETTTDLEMIASGLIDTLKEHAKVITRITRDVRGLTYPKRTDTGRIPADAFTRGDAENVGCYAKEIIKLVKEFYL